MQGNAEFIKQTDSKYLFNENGSYELNYETYNFFQNYIFCITKNNLTIFKKDGRILHEFLLPENITYPLKLNHVHNCSKDKYEVVFLFESITQFKTNYKIFGQNKNYTISTIFEKLQHYNNHLA